MSSSSDLDTTIHDIARKKSTKKSKSKSKSKLTAVVEPEREQTHEGDEDPRWAYEPPQGAVLLDHAVDAGPFDWDAIDDDDDAIELWLVRVPDTIKPRHLEGLTIDPPSSSRTACIGSLTRKHAAYDVWSVGDDDDARIPGADELGGLTCLFPRKSQGGRLYVAPKPISRHVVVVARPSIATPAEVPFVCQNPPRASYPKDVLKHAFVPYGARSAQTPSDLDASMDVETTMEKPVEEDKSPKNKESNGKKRKVDGESPKRKKSKKHKADV